MPNNGNPSITIIGTQKAVKGGSYPRFAAVRRLSLTAPKLTQKKFKKSIDNKRKVRYTKYIIERR